MKRALFYIAFAAILFTGCENKPKQVLVDFDVERISPLMVRFTNTSVGCDSYKWDFGNGTWAYGRDALCTYESTGTYTVTLTATADGTKYDRRRSLEITKPDVYFAGFTIYKIPYENKYYRLVFKDDALLPSDWDWYTIYTPLLDDTDLPYTYYLQNPQLVENPDSHDYWTITLVRNTTTSGADDTNCLKAKLTRKDLQQYQPEYIFRSESGTTAFSVLMGYDY